MGVPAADSLDVAVVLVVCFEGDEEIVAVETEFLVLKEAVGTLSTETRVVGDGTEEFGATIVVSPGEVGAFVALMWTGILGRKVEPFVAAAEPLSMVAGGRGSGAGTVPIEAPSLVTWSLLGGVEVSITEVYWILTGMSMDEIGACAADVDLIGTSMGEIGACAAEVGLISTGISGEEMDTLVTASKPVSTVVGGWGYFGGKVGTSVTEDALTMVGV